MYFKTLYEVRTMAEQWRLDYNVHRPHAALNYKTPMGGKGANFLLIKSIHNVLTPAYIL